MSEATHNQDPKPLSDEELAAAAAMTPTDPLADAQAELANLKAQNADLADQYLRAQADVQNARRRADDEIAKA
ncbi:MAG: Protein GrpE, partial [Pseudomonadota bacterium]